MLGPFPHVYCDFCGKECLPEDAYRFQIVERKTRFHHDLGHTLHLECGQSVRALLLEYGGVSLTNGRTQTLLPGPGAYE
jgi:hypothetical protein